MQSVRAEDEEDLFIPITDDAPPRHEPAVKPLTAATRIFLGKLSTPDCLSRHHEAGDQKLQYSLL